MTRFKTPVNQLTNCFPYVIPADQDGNVVMIPNPEPCAGFANRKLIEWLADVVKRNNKEVAAAVAAYAKAKEQEMAQSMGTIKITPLLDVSTAGTVASGTAP